MNSRRQIEEWEETAAALHRDGYNSAVVSRRMIDEHGMPEEAAVALVSRLYGKKVNPRAGDTASALVRALAMIAVGLGGIAAVWIITGALFRTHVLLISIPLLALAGRGLERTIHVLVTAGEKEPL
ncbi:MAG TPA: hypothetical protein VIG99_01800 [Myxococcaceae bacterium]|jgi:hypothetical protein